MPVVFGFLGIALLSLAGGVLWLNAMRRDATRDRLLFGMVEDAEASPEDLSAGDYGLRGRKRFAYHASRFLQTWPGRGLIASLGGLSGYGAAFLSGLTPLRSGGVAAAAAILSLLAGLLIVRMRRRRFERAVRKELPSALELLAAIMEGGLGFDAALAYMLREADPEHPLYFDLGIVNEAMQRGRRRAEALRLWAARCNIAAVADVAAALVQADQTGGSIGRVLHHHARALFRENEAEVERRAERLPIRMILPMLLTIFPAMFVVAGMPSFLRILRVLESITKGASRVAGGGG